MTMDISKRKAGYIWFIEIALIVVVSALVYLPNLTRATIYRDNWYYTVDRLKGGPGTFQEMFRIDRPVRGPLFELYYQLFSYQPLPYHLASYFWRLLSGLGALWLFTLIWPNNRRANLTLALLFTLYPGYFRWMEGFEDQPQMMSLCLEVFSIAFTVKAIQTERLLRKISFWLGAILTGWIYIALVDFAIGMEFFRLLCVSVVILRNQGDVSPRNKAISILRSWAPAILIPVGFLFWRFLVFQNERAATDLGLQLSYMLNSPFLRGAWWLVRLFQSTVNTAFLAWTAPRFDQLAGLRLTDIAIGAFIVFAVVIIVVLTYILLNRLDQGTQTSREPHQNQRHWQKEAVLVGLFGVIGGLSVIIIVNRFTTFGDLSHYALPASLASTTMMVGLFYYIAHQRMRLISITFLIVLAVINHYVYSSQVLNEEKTVREFWQQVGWRVPGLRAGTTLVVNYPGVGYGEDIDIVTGPANFIYYPEQTNQTPVLYQLAALNQLHDTTTDILTGGNQLKVGRTNTWNNNYDNILVISQPSQSSCVHVIDGRWPYYSVEDRDQILIAGEKSKIENVITDSEYPHLDESIFGPEPAHTWCYYFEKATLAIQEGDWQQAVDLGKQAIELGFHPNDRVEWIPFLQANAVLGNLEAFKEIAVRMSDLKFNRLQACDILNQMQESGYQFSMEIKEQTAELLCYGHP